MAQVKLPAQPALQIGAVGLDTVRPIKVSASGNGVYRAPDGYQSPDLAASCQPPASLGQFYPKQ